MFRRRRSRKALLTKITKVREMADELIECPCGHYTHAPEPTDKLLANIGREIRAVINA